MLLRVIRALLLGMLLPITAHSTIYIVHPDGSGDFSTIRDAIQAAQDFDVIELGDGTFRGPGNRDLTLRKRITIRSMSGDPARCILDCEGSSANHHQAFKDVAGTTDATTIERITITNGYSQYGGAIHMYGGAPTIRGCIFLGNRASDWGGAISCSNASPARIIRCLFIDNEADERGGAIACFRASPTISGCTFFGNRSPGGSSLSCDDAYPDIDRTILSFGELGPAVSCEDGGYPILACSNIYGHQGGDWVGCIEGKDEVAGNFSADPLFCDAGVLDFTLMPESPCLSSNAPCESVLIGALDQGCPPAPTGACCVEGGACLEVSEDICAAEIGAYAGDGVPCSATNCAVACCFNPLCVLLPEFQCIESGGIVYEGWSCDPVPCCSGSSLVQNHDGSFEYAYSWTYDLQPPNHGSFAEGFSGPGVVCGVAFSLTCTNSMAVPVPDLYIWDNQDGNPGAVLALVPETHLGPIATWPTVSRHTADIGATVEKEFFVGLWPNFEDTPYFIAADLNGPGGIPRTKVPPGTKFPTGWHDVNDIWDDGVMSLGIEIYMDPVPTEALGACCFENGTCSRLTASLCALGQGVYQGDDVDCFPVTCGGACCFEEGTCSELTEQECILAGGEYLGTGVSCHLHPCPSVGACCMDTGQCVVLTPAECVDDGGLYLGNNVICPAGGCNRNAGGVLLVHANPALDYTGGEAYCGQSGLETCWNANFSIAEDGPQILHVVAAFPEGSQSAITATAFGIQYDATIGVLDYGKCADSELPEASWPNAGSGTVVLWDKPQTSTLVELYWFAAYNYDQTPSTFELIPHPERGGVFFDDSFPAKEDPIVCFGIMGFDTSGERCCPWEHRGACCLGTGGCFYVNEAACDEMSGSFLGAGVSCLPNPCTLTAIDPAGVAGNVRLVLEGPNPAATQLRFGIELSERADVEVKVYDLRGALVQTLFDGEMNDGRQTLTWDIARKDPSLPNGVYYARLRARGEVISTRFVIYR